MKIGFQGSQGAYSHKAAKEMFPKAQHKAYISFEDAAQALINKDIDFALLPISNSNAGRVSGVHNIIFENNLYIVDEYFLPVHHNLIVNKGVKFSDLERVYSHPQALAQCSDFIRKHSLKEVIWSDTAESVKHIVETESKHGAAIASDLAAEIYGAKILKKNIENDKNNTTRFVLLSRDLKIPKSKNGVITSVFFITKNIPAALYKSLAGFATEGINLIMIESFMPMKRNGRARFYLEFEGHPEQESVKRALHELEFYSQEYRIVGVYKERKHR